MNGNSNLFVLFCRNNTLGLFVNDRQSPSLQLTEQLCVPLVSFILKILNFFGKVFSFLGVKVNAILIDRKKSSIIQTHYGDSKVMDLQGCQQNSTIANPNLVYFYFFYLCVSGAG